jgi:hypothetical protein
MTQLCSIERRQRSQHGVLGQEDAEIDEPQLAEEALRIGRYEHGTEALARHVALGRLVIAQAGRIEREIASDVPR